MGFVVAVNREDGRGGVGRSVEITLGEAVIGDRRFQVFTDNSRLKSKAAAHANAYRRDIAIGVVMMFQGRKRRVNTRIALVAQAFDQFHCFLWCGGNLSLE